ncbi:MAG TPA: T9SS type A sorting domain-containing protein [Bacteroidales bacterium]|nr:T9SS type A sorting domain-containing protein [Bacteroidales bacterium]HPT02840.1 T9SS type A sorting domain-containing protein [Bacteroidales bacterium]
MKMNYLFFVLVLFSCMAGAKGETYIVMNGSDSGDLSLRHFIEISGPYDTILFSADVDTVTLTSDELKIEQPLCILGNENKTVIRRDPAAGTPDFRIFRLVNSGVVYFKNLVICNGKSICIGGVYPQPGGGIQINDTLSYLYIDHCILHSNLAASGPDLGYSASYPAPPGASGGAIANYGHLEIKNSDIYNNSAGTGGRKTIVKSDNSMYDCFPSNGGSGGGIWSGHYLKIENCKLTGNSSGYGGFCPDPLNPGSGWWAAGGSGGALCIISGSSTSIINSIISGNKVRYGTPAGSGGGILSAGNLDILSSTITRNYSMSPNETGGGMKLNNAVTSVRNSIIFGNYLQVSTNLSDVSVYDGSYIFSHSLVGKPVGFEITDTTNLIGEDPSFISIDDLRLAFNSPCINTGDPDTTGLPPIDLAGMPKVVENRVDMGAYEFQGYSWDHKNSANPEIFIYPNPCTDKITIFIPEYLKNSVLEVHLIDVAGQVLSGYSIAKGSSSFCISLPASLPKGIYYLEAHTSDHISAHKIIKL